MELTAALIHRVTGLPMKGNKVPMEMPSATMIREYLRSEGEGTNSKGLRIGQATHEGVRWALIDVCLTNAG